MAMKKKVFTALQLLCGLLCLCVLFTAIPFVHAAIGGYVKVFLVWGALVLAADWRTRRWVKAPGILWLALFAAAYLLTLFFNRVADVAALSYMLLFFFVLYPPGGGEEEVRLLLWVFCGVTALFALVCLVTFLLQIQYKTTLYTAGYPVPVVIGVSDNRLHGLYNCNTGSTLNLLSSAFSLLLLKTAGRWGRVFHGGNLVLQYLCLLLTLSRAAWYMYIVFVFLYLLVTLPRRRWLAAVAAVLVVLLAGPVKVGLSYLPAAVGAPTDRSRMAETAESDRVDLSRLENTEEVGVFTGRTELWQGGWRAFLKQPLFGTSYRRLYAAAAPYVPERWLPNLQRGGLHNMPLTVLVCSGGVGAALLLAFFARTGWRVVRNWRRLSPLARGIAITLLCLLGVELMEARLLYSTTVFGFVFWTMYGYLMGEAA